ncbi:CoxG family protein [Aeribacillus pallidus]|uniref:Carbon monoxide dehydrogenase n=1 Tax=Aeribacillus pallidus TaxID=33936 RepID=A0A223E307_9BACI|nr:SRPBCC domain-containing protein [Aeribacillus pallidus]ASS89637.1 hypothetical protein AP3564_04635 [Aeribacillus pallidus]
MKFSDSLIIEADKQSIWDVFMDVEKLGGCVPGCKDLIAKSETEYEANMEVKTKFMKINFKANGFLKDAVEGEKMDIELVGKPLKLAGNFKAKVNLRLEELEPKKTKVVYDMDMQMTGRLASLGDILMKNTIKKSAAEFTENVHALFSPANN